MLCTLAKGQVAKTRIGSRARPEPECRLGQYLAIVGYQWLLDNLVLFPKIPQPRLVLRSDESKQIGDVV